MRGYIVKLVVLVIVSSFLLGCGAPTEEVGIAEQRAGMAALARVYQQYRSQHRGSAPKSEKALRKFIETETKKYPGFMESLQVESADELFISPRDGEPYVVIYGKPKGKVVAYESVGVDGKRFVADDLAVAELVEEAKFREMVPDAE